MKAIKSFLPFLAITVSIVSIAISYSSYLNSLEAVRPRPQLLDYEAWICPNSEYGMENSTILVRFRATNNGGRRITLLHIEPDSLINGWLAVVDEANHVHRISGNYKLAINIDPMMNFTRTTCSLEGLSPMEKSNAIQINQRIDPGAATRFDIGLIYFPIEVRADYYFVAFIAEFSDGTRLRMTTSLK